MTRAAIYARYSSHAQNDESIEQQLAVCEEYARTHDMRVVATYADRAISGRSDRRPEFQRMIRAAEARSFDAVIAYKSNRIARNMLDALRYESRLDACGVRLVYAREEFGDTATGRFMLRSMMNLNQFYSENMGEDIMRGMTENAKKLRVNGNLPLGYKTGPDGKYAIDEATAPIVREIFRRIAAGETRASIAADLNRRGIRTHTGGRWNKGSFDSMVKNERYCGVYLFNGIRVEGGIPAILTREEFDAAHGLKSPQIKARHRRPDHDYLLTGKLFCGPCQAAMHGTSGTSRNGQTHFYYRCPKCKATIRADLAEHTVSDALKQAISSDAAIDGLIAMVQRYQAEMAAQSDLSALQARLSEVQSAKRNIMRAIEAGAISVTLTTRLTELERDEDETQFLIQKEKKHIPDVREDVLRYFFKQFQTGNVDDPAYQKLLIDTFLRSAYVWPDRMAVTFDFGEDRDTGVDLPTGSYKDEDGPPLFPYPNIFIVNGVFVIVVRR